VRLRTVKHDSREGFLATEEDERLIADALSWLRISRLQLGRSRLAAGIRVGRVRPRRLIALRRDNCRVSARFTVIGDGTVVIVPARQRRSWIGRPRDARARRSRPRRNST
jgi:hypothetical protein